MGLFANERSNWLGIVVNPIGYVMDHKSVGDAANDHARTYPPGKAVNRETVDEITFKTDRQQWIDSCASALKSGDVGYSKANCAQACAARFDSDPIATQVKQALAAKSAEEKTLVQSLTAKNTQKILWIIGAFLLIGLLLFLFLS